MNSDLGLLLDRTTSFAHEAADHLTNEFTRAGGPRGAGDKAAVDSEIEHQLRRQLLDLHDCSFVGEETVPHLRGDHADCWVVDPHDGTSAFLEGYHGSAVSIALLRDGVPVFGIVCAPPPPDRGRDFIAWAEGQAGVTRNGSLIVPDLAERQLAPGELVFLNHVSAQSPVVFGKAVAPARFIALPSIAYRLARVAAGDGVAAVSLSGPCGYDYAAGHALLRGATGVLLNEAGAPVTYSRHGDSNVRHCFGGSPRAAATLASRKWQTPRRDDRLAQRPSRKIYLHAPLVRSRARGCLIGQIVGDSLGSLVEFKSAREVRRLYPGGVRHLADGGVWNTLAGQPTDDSELALALVRSIVAKGRYDEETVAEAYGRWYGSDPFDMGGTTRRGLSAAFRASEGKASAARVAASTHSQSNGSLMRVSPIGIWARDPRLAAEYAARDSMLSHPNPVCVAACASYVAAIAKGIRSGDVEAMMGVAEACPGVPGNDVIGTALSAAKGGAKPRDADGDKQGWVAIAYQNAFYHLARRTPFEEALVETIDLGGDTDTNAAIAGALLGAAYGIEAIPPRMVQAVLACRPHRDLGAPSPRPEEYWPDDTLELADALLEATSPVSDRSDNNHPD